MKLNVLTIALALTAFGAMSANAEELIIKERAPGVVIKEEVPVPSVTIRERETTGFRREDCTTKTVTKTVTKTDADRDASKTVKKTTCD
jgi:hypothetical protein